MIDRSTISCTLRNSLDEVAVAARHYIMQLGNSNNPQLSLLFCVSWARSDRVSGIDEIRGKRSVAEADKGIERKASAIKYLYSLKDNLNCVEASSNE